MKPKHLAWASVAAAFCLRVIPSWTRVFTPAGVNFQEGDAWFHMRTVHNLLAHFPWRSSFDPYLRFPGGGEVPTGPFWDYAVASLAWIAGADTVGAWLPAVLGALLAFPVFQLGARLFGTIAGLFAALWIAVMPGTLLWMTHLGLADHHAAESFLALLVLVWLCAALESPEHRYWIGAGLALSMYLATRPSGVFVPGILACSVLLAPASARVILYTVAVAAAVSAPFAGTLAELSLAAAAAAALAAMLPLKPRALLAATAVALAFVLRPYWFAVLLWQVRRYGGHLDATRVVQELAPLLRSHSPSAWGSLWYQLGSSWIVALPAMVWLAALAARKRRPTLTLFAVWSAVTIAGAFIQVRMLVYGAVAAAVLAGAACTWLARGNRLLAAAIAILVIATNLPQSLRQMETDNGPSGDWRQVLSWLRWNSPEPLGDEAAWYRRYSAGPPYRYPASAYGVAVMWDAGYWVQSLARRIPAANGTLAGSREMAEFFIGTDPQAADAQLRRMGARYVVVDPKVAYFGAVGNSHFPAMLLQAERDPEDFFRMLVQEEEGRRTNLLVYLPAYYHTMAARLYLADAESTAGDGPWLFETRRTNGQEIIVWRMQFAAEREALAFMGEHPSRRLLLACIDPGRSCVSVAAAPALRRVFSSDPLPISPERTVRAVKVFQVAGL